jgi:hypothetical protein
VCDSIVLRYCNRVKPYETRKPKGKAQMNQRGIRQLSVKTQESFSRGSGKATTDVRTAVLTQIVLFSDPSLIRGNQAPRWREYSSGCSARLPRLLDVGEVSIVTVVVRSPFGVVTA